MNKHYSSYRGRRTRSRRNEGGGWKRMCFLGVLVGLALMCNVFFHDQVEAVRSGITGGLERGGYIHAMSAIGSALNGEQSFREAWSEAVTAITVKGGDAVKASVEGGERVPPSGESKTPNGTGKVAFDLLKNGLYYTLPDDAGGSNAAGYTFDPDDALMTFDFLELPDKKDVTAYQDGVVVADGDSELYGTYLIILHGDVTAQYFHCGKLYVRSGDFVTQGQVIAAAPEG